MDELVGPALHLLTVQAGRLAVWAASLGRWRGEKFWGDEGRLYSAAGSLSFKHEGQWVITETGLMFFGIAFFVVLFFVVCLVMQIFKA